MPLPFNSLHRDMQLDEATNPVRRVLNIGTASPGNVHAVSQFYQQEATLPGNPRLNNRYVQSDASRAEFHHQPMMECPPARFHDSSARENDIQELNFQMLLSQQISKQGFSIRTFLEQRNSSVDLQNVSMAKKQIIPTVNFALYADESEEALFAVSSDSTNRNLNLIHVVSTDVCVQSSQV